MADQWTYVYGPGRLLAWTIKCNLHKAGGKCTSSLNVGPGLSSDEAKRRIKYWCVRGQGIADDASGTFLHMRDKPRRYSEPIPSHDELDRLVERSIVLWYIN